MPALKLAIGCAWIVFWFYWITSAATSKESTASGWRTRLTGVTAIGVFLIAGVLRGGSLAVHNWIVAAISAAEMRAPPRLASLRSPSLNDPGGIGSLTAMRP